VFTSLFEVSACSIWWASDLTDLIWHLICPIYDRQYKLTNPVEQNSSSDADVSRSRNWSTYMEPCSQKFAAGHILRQINPSPYPQCWPPSTPRVVKWSFPLSYLFPHFICTRISVILHACHISHPFHPWRLLSLDMTPCSLIVPTGVSDECADPFFRIKEYWILSWASKSSDAATLGLSGCPVVVSSPSLGS
jgi:hypothetical protein